MITCIVVDDDKTIREILSEILELEGLSVVASGNNGEDAVRLFQEHRPAIIFLDVRMPKMNGIEALRKIRKMSHDVKVIMVTADSAKNVEEVLWSTGATNIIFKPFKMETIRISLNKIDVTTITHQ